jgi:O-antigen ligase
MTALARGVTFVAPLVFPAAAILFALTGSRLLALAPLALALLASAQFSVATNIVAILFGLGAGALALWRPRAIIVGLGALFLATLLTAPLFALAPADAVLNAESALLPPSWAQRVNLWKEAGDRILDGCFLAGCGADYTRAWGAEGAMIDVPGSPIPLKEAPMHPHNLFLQIWLELGIFGVLTIGVALSFALRRLASVEPQRLAFAAIAGASAAAYISFMFEASLWQAWRIAVLSLAAFGAALSYSLNGSRRS